MDCWRYKDARRTLKLSFSPSVSVFSLQEKSESQSGEAEKSDATKENLQILLRLEMSCEGEVKLRIRPEGIWSMESLVYPIITIHNFYGQFGIQYGSSLLSQTQVASY